MEIVANTAAVWYASVTDMFTATEFVCPTVELQQDFDVEALMGSWYQMKKPVDFRWSKGDCGTTHYDSLEENNFVVHFNA